MKKVSNVNMRQLKNRLLKRTPKASVAVQNVEPDYRPTYRESHYRRPVLFRLTALSRFILSLALLMLFGVAILAFNHAIDGTNGTQRLSDRMPMQPDVIIFDLLTPTPTRRVRPTAAPAPTAEPTMAPTVDPSKAAWARQLITQADGTLMAPREVVAKAAADIGAYYSTQRDMPLNDYEAKHDQIQTGYFTGRALDYIRGLEAGQTFYEMNRAGRFSVEIRRFTPDGLSATAGIIKRDWVSDVYDRVTKELLTRGKTSNDTLTLSTITYDQASERWKFASIDEVMELTP